MTLTAIRPDHFIDILDGEMPKNLVFTDGTQYKMLKEGFTLVAQTPDKPTGITKYTFTAIKSPEQFNEFKKVKHVTWFVLPPKASNELLFDMNL